MQSDLINEIMKRLFAAEERRLEAGIRELNTQNKRLRNVQIDGFIYGGVFYRPMNGTLTLAGPGQAKTMLHFSLNHEMEAWLTDSKTTKTDKDLIRQMVFRLLKPARTEREYRNALPECLVTLMPTLSQHPRADEAGYTLQGDERAMRQFEKLVPKMEVYSASRLLY